MIKRIWTIIILVIFLLLIYTSKVEDYETKIEFYNRSFSSEIAKIVEGRGTKVYYNYFDKRSYFYLNDYQGIKLKVGDVIRKNNNEIVVMRKNVNGEYIQIGEGKSLKPEESYFKYFF